MIISTKCQYALRAVFEIARAVPGSVVTIGDVAKAQNVPQRYLEGILNQLRKGGLLEAQRGRHGGYKLAKATREITVGDVVRVIDGTIRAVECVEEGKGLDCPMRDHCVFLPTWQRVQKAIDLAMDESNFEELLKVEQESRTSVSTNYSI
jgi:Rrf2 family cysteine metabolism transcriptional repressor